MPKRIPRMLLGALLAAALAATAAAAPATAAPAARRHHHPSAPLVEGHAPSLHPEDAAYDPTRGTYLIGSLRHGTVSVLRPDGSVNTLVDDPRLVSVLGMAVDARRGRILVADGDPGFAENTSPRTAGRHAVLAAYDLRTGAPLFRTDLAEVAADGGAHLANDVVVGADGTAYVTDSFAPVVYAVDRRGGARVLVRDEALDGRGGFGANGILLAGASLIVGHYRDGTLWRIRLHGDHTPHRVDAPELPGADGMALRRDGSIAVAVNALDSAGTDAVYVLRGSRHWRAAVVTVAAAWPDAAPTAPVLGPCGATYVLSGDLDVLFGGGSSDEFRLRLL